MSKIINMFAKLGCYTLISLLGVLAVLFGTTFFNVIVSFWCGILEAITILINE